MTRNVHFCYSVCTLQNLPKSLKNPNILKEEFTNPFLQKNCDNDSICTCHNYLGSISTSPICVASPKVAKASIPTVTITGIYANIDVEIVLREVLSQSLN